MKKTKVAVSNVGTEEMEQLKNIVLTREDTRMQADALFGGDANKARKDDSEKVKKLFVQAPAVISTAQNLQEINKTASVNAFFDKLAHDSFTDAQRRYPELLKVAQTPTPDLRPRTTTQALKTTLPAAKLTGAGS